MRARSLGLLAVLGGAFCVAACTADAPLDWGGDSTGTPTPEPTLPPCGLGIPAGGASIYVSTTGMDSAETGTADQPVATLDHAFDRGLSVTTAYTIFVRGGEYVDDDGTLQLTANGGFPRDVRVYGAFNADWTKRDEVLHPTRARVGPSGLRIGNEGFPRVDAVLDGLVIVAGTGNTPGQASYGVFAVAADVTTNCVEITAGQGQRGDDGTDAGASSFGPAATLPPKGTPPPAPNGTLGGPGADGCNNGSSQGGAGGEGAGGIGDTGTAGEVGGLGSGGSGGMAGGDDQDGADGGDGLDGSPGDRGAAGPREGTFSSSGWSGSAGGDGTSGTDGFGGGGGGGAGYHNVGMAPGGGGGGGGGGGCGGALGAGGQAGGGSIAVFLWDATLEAATTLFRVLGGGAGGDGGNALPGQPGGEGSPGFRFSGGMVGGSGGLAGAGGHGGSGAGGSGGASVGVMLGDPLSAFEFDAETSALIFVIASGGAGGAAGQSLGNEGDPGPQGLQESRFQAP